MEPEIKSYFNRVSTFCWARNEKQSLHMDGHQIRHNSELFCFKCKKMSLKKNEITDLSYFCRKRKSIKVKYHIRTTTKKKIIKAFSCLTSTSISDLYISTTVIYSFFSCRDTFPLLLRFFSFLDTNSCIFDSRAIRTNVLLLCKWITCHNTYITVMIMPQSIIWRNFRRRRLRLMCCVA